MERKKHDSKGLSHRSAIWGGLALAAVSAVAVCVMGASRVELKKQEVLENYSASVSTWLEGTSDTARLWKEELRELRLRISDAETYRLFADDLFGLDRSVASRVNATTEENAAASGMLVSEEVPTIRRLLKEYMDFSGLADARIIGEGGLTLLSAQSSPAALSPAQQKAAVEVLKSGKSVALPVRASLAGLMLDVFEPMHSLESDRVVAVFMGTHPVLASFTQFTARPKPEELSEAFFLQRGTRLEDGLVPWQLIVSPQPKSLDAVLGSQLEEGKGALPLALRPSVSSLGLVYSASYRVPGSDWSVMLETPAAVLDQRIFKASIPVYVACGLGWAAFMLLCLLVWWVGIGRQQKAIANEMRELNHMVSLQKELLDRVNTSLDMALLMIDVKGQIHVCNSAFAEIAGGDIEALTGQMIFNCLPLEQATEIVDRVRQVALNSREDGCEFWMDTPQADGSSVKKLYRVSLFPFRETGHEAAEQEKLSGAVVTLKDVTEFRRRAERARQQQRRLIEAFTSVEASADPYLHGFSLRMADLAERVAKSMNLSEDSRNTVVMGAQLSQMGKLFIPHELLTKQGKLSPEELAEVRRAPEHAARVLESVDFDLPIARTLHEMYENVDGSGYPRGLKGDDILFEARFLGVMNAFCAMVSDRSYRQGMSNTAALGQLRGNAKFDQDIVEELAKAVEK